MPVREFTHSDIDESQGEFFPAVFFCDGIVMALVTIKPNEIDVAIADAIARKTRPFPEQVARTVTWAADEKLLLALAAAGWFVTRTKPKSLRRAGNHVLLVTATASLLPHVLKLIFDQTRPDRETVLGHLHGVSRSGKRNDAFPSGHALHMGALASVAGAWPQPSRATARGLAVGLSLTRVFILAHWASDVVFGFVIGVALERSLRLWTGYPKMLRASTPRSKRETQSAASSVEPSRSSEVLRDAGY
jgi:membrane-associated phospholipid phosphatase